MPSQMGWQEIVGPRSSGRRVGRRNSAEGHVLMEVHEKGEKGGEDRGCGKDCSLECRVDCKSRRG